MKKNKKIFFFFSLAIFIILLIWSFYTKAVLSNVELISPQSISKINMPYTTQNSIWKNYSIKFDITDKYKQLTTMHLVADDCVKKVLINNININLNTISKKQLCDYKQGFSLKVTPYLKDNSINHVEIFIKNKGGPTGLDIDFYQNNFSFNYIIRIITWLFFAILIFFIPTLLELHFSISLLFTIGIVLRLLILIYTPFTSFTYDVFGHIDYIKYIAEHYSLPQSTQCWQCYHQPLYYILIAPIYMIASSIDTIDVYKSLQSFSLFLHAGILLFFLLILKKVKFPLITQIFVGSIIIFMPSMIMHSMRIGNDVLLYFMFIGSLYFFVTWTDNTKNFWYAILFAVLALFSKTNGVIVMIIIIGSLFIYTYLDYKQYIRKMIIALSVFLLAGTIAVNIHVSRNKTYEIVSNATMLPNGLLVENKVENYLYFDLKTYINEPFTNAWSDKQGRQYFWNYLLKTSLFGEFSFSNNHLKTLASLISFIYLLLLLFVLLGILIVKKEDIKIYTPFLFNLLLLLLGAVYLRIVLPYSCSSDFRYILPIVISGAFFLGVLINRTLKTPYVLVNFILLGSIFLFSILSFLFWIVYYIEVI